MWVWTFEPTEVVPLCVVAALYLRRTWTLALRGRRPPTWKTASFMAGLGVAAVALFSPIDWLGENRSFAVHMVQHLLLGDIAPLLCVAGLSGPLLRPILAVPLIGRLRALAHPVAAFAIWAVDLGLWHTTVLYQAALENDAIHASEHLLFFVCGSLVWCAILEPLPGPAWFGTAGKLLLVFAMRVYVTLLSLVFVFPVGVIYPYYEHVPRLWGMSVVTDQHLAGAVMLAEGWVVTLAALCWLLCRWFSEDELRAELIDHGVPQRTAARAVRYGRGDALLEAAGFASGVEPRDG